MNCFFKFTKSVTIVSCLNLCQNCDFEISHSKGDSVLKLIFGKACFTQHVSKSNRKAMNRNWNNQNANLALKTKAGNK